ncbi:MAG: hypothetical protein ACTSWW_07585 [Promethearchaeota archaeon]
MTHRLTSPILQSFQPVSFVKTCLGSQHPFGLGEVTLSARLQDGIRFFQHPQPPTSSLILASEIPALRLGCMRFTEFSLLDVQ